MDVLKQFNLDEQPFNVGPDPRFLYLSDQVKEAIAKCEYMARERIGPIYMYGPIGTGKTTIIRRLHERLSLDDKYNVAFAICPNLKSANAFLRLILERFDVRTDRAYADSLRNFESFLLDQYQAGKVPVLLLDEGENLTRDAFRLLHYLLNFETATTKLLQIVIAGQQELATNILRYHELSSRMFPIGISAMSAQELQDMVRFRWLVAGGKDLPFHERDQEWAKTLYAYSKGLARDAVKVCGELLRDMAISDRRTWDSDYVASIAKEMNLQA